MRPAAITLPEKIRRTERDKTVSIIITNNSKEDSSYGKAQIAATAGPSRIRGHRVPECGAGRWSGLVAHQQFSPKITYSFWKGLASDHRAVGIVNKNNILWCVKTTVVFLYDNLDAA
jgi:hypothetical protein